MSHAARAPWRDNIEAMTMAIVMALLLKYFVIEAYKIPTGSMQPTLIGDDESGIKDRILVDKLSYTLRSPRRWEVVIFRYPLDRSKNFVKRIAGVGPEQFRIERGDLWSRADEGEEWRVLRRPQRVQEEAWKALDSADPEEPSWRIRDARSDWRGTGRSIFARSSGSAAFQGGKSAILDLYLDGYPESLRHLIKRQNASSGSNVVGDLRVDGSVRALAGMQFLTVELHEGDLRYAFRIPGPAAPQDARPEITVRHEGDWDDDLEAVYASGEPYRLPVDVPVRFGAQNMDDLLELEVAGETVCQLGIAPADDQRSAAWLHVEGAGADLEDLMVYRDIYYTASLNEPVDVPAGHYYMLGDNTQDSSDSRVWSYARLRTEDVEGNEETLRGNHRRGENPRIVGFGDDDGPKELFVDEWGEPHWFRVGATEKMSPESAPFVPEEMILGRALAVFWPLDPRLGVYRLKWVD